MMAGSVPNPAGGSGGRGGWRAQLAAQLALGGVGQASAQFPDFQGGASLGDWKVAEGQGGPNARCYGQQQSVNGIPRGLDGRG